MAMLRIIVTVNSCGADVPNRFVAVNFKLCVPFVPSCGAPLKTPVSVFKSMPAGKLPSAMAKEIGSLLAVIEKLSVVPSVKIALLPEVMTGAVVICGSNVKVDSSQLIFFPVTALLPGI